MILLSFYIFVKGFMDMPFIYAVSNPQVHIYKGRGGKRKTGGSFILFWGVFLTITI